ncbi:MAG: DUF2786 domain-containing protein [Nitriliruptor sp.]|uniref:DUF2786 domain-containing protein n=1 Tax=Nitriliruptor sp. TaxID=2448056 RepID=UPI0034A09368
MGRNNKQRRAANKRRKQRASRPPPRRPGGTGPSGGPRHERSGPDRQDGSHEASRVEELLRAAVAAWGHDLARFAELLDTLTDRLHPALDAAQATLAAVMPQLWSRGWTPAELVHVVSRQLTTAHVEVVAEQAVADGRARQRCGESLHPRWADQLEELEGAAASRLPLDTDRLRHLIEVLGFLSRLPVIPHAMPAPDQRGTRSAPATGHLDARMLGRVRALLAKAEATNFEEEAEAFTAKAQELIARHAIDEALLHGVDDVGEPSLRRILVDDPYADAKAHLIAQVAEVNRCRVVYSSGLGWITAFGYDHDLDAVELLATSLLAQATAAMVRQGPRRDGAGRSRTRSFRRSFLYGFGQRIGERLRRATEEQVAASGDDGRLLPVLAARDDRVEAAARDAFPELVQKTTSISNGSGWSAGRVAAEQANLEVGRRRLDASGVGA